MVESFAYWFFGHTLGVCLGAAPVIIYTVLLLWAYTHIVNKYRGY